MHLRLFAIFIALAGTSWSATGHPLPASVRQALALARVPPDALSVVISSIPATSTLSTQPLAGAVLPPRLQHRADIQRNPASVMKLVTTYAALDTLGADFTWKNRVYTDGFVGHNGNPGVLEGNLILRGSGDPKLVLERIQDLFAQVQASGVREVRGDIVLDRSVFDVPNTNPADFDDEPLRPYNVLPDGFLLNFKSLIFSFTPDEARGRAIVRSEPPIAGVDIPAEVPLAKGVCADWKGRLHADFFTPVKIHFGGGYAASCGERVWPVAYSDPHSYAVRVVEAMWHQSGGKLSGQVRMGTTPRNARLLLTAESLPLADIIADVNKFSNNVMAQQVFLTLSAQNRQGSFSATQRVVTAWWKKNFSGHALPVLENGSGLSRKERASASALTALLHHAGTSANAQVFTNSLGIAGVDGTAARMKERNAASQAIGRAFLKTGTLKDVAAIAGYVNAASGQRYSIVAIINHANAGAARGALDALVEWTVQDQ